MRRYLFASVAVLACGSFVSANDPVVLEGFGLDGLQSIGDTEGKEVRGFSATSSASGLSSLGVIFYDTLSGSKASVDLVSFSAGAEDGAAPGSAVGAQSFNGIGMGTGLYISFPGSPAGAVSPSAFLSAFGAGGSSQGLANRVVTPFSVPTPATFVP
jgi:hypothetical protein